MTESHTHTKQVIHKAIVHHPPTDAQPVPEQHHPPGQLPLSFLLLYMMSCVTNIALASLGQLSWFCPFLVPFALPQPLAGWSV